MKEIKPCHEVVARLAIMGCSRAAEGRLGTETVQLHPCRCLGGKHSRQWEETVQRSHSRREHIMSQEEKVGWYARTQGIVDTGRCSQLSGVHQAGAW